MNDPTLLLLFFSILIFSCGDLERKARVKMLENKSVYSVNLFGETWEREYKIEYDSIGRSMAEGSYAIRKDGETGTLRVGEWKEYYPETGNLRSVGNYKIGSYYFCGSTPSVNCYNYKEGFWEYFYESGNIKAEGEYKLIEAQIENNCEGGTIIKFGIIDENWNLNEQIEDSMLNWNTLKEFQLVNQGSSNIYSEIGVNEKRETILEQN